MEKQLSVIADHNSATNVYIQSATLNGNPLDRPVITYDEIMAGATLRFKMGPKPSMWGADWKPLSIRTMDRATATPSSAP